VGFTGFGLMPVFLLLAIVTQLAYWLTSGGYTRWRKNADRKAFNRALHSRSGHRFGHYLLLAPLLMLLMGAANPPDNVWHSNGGSYVVSYSSELNPVSINRIHQWILHLETPDGEPVADADIKLSGGMPAHDHGLPTEPDASQYLGNGDYLLEGMRFHMMGEWEITLEITLGNKSETVLIPLSI
ncbi:MAG: FixH family protein, partial [Pseudohongiellaceae bacterium]